MYRILCIAVTDNRSYHRTVIILAQSVIDLHPVARPSHTFFNAYLIFATYHIIHSTDIPNPIFTGLKSKIWENMI